MRIGMGRGKTNRRRTGGRGGGAWEMWSEAAAPFVSTAPHAGELLRTPRAAGVRARAPAAKKTDFAAKPSVCTGLRPHDCT